MKIISKTDLLLSNLIEFYKNKHNYNIFLSVVNQETSLSLRILDSLVTNYSKNFNVIYNLNAETKTPFNMYISYKSQLKAYSKKYFDPFCRRQRIFIKNSDLSYEYIDNINEYEQRQDGIITTIGQINFFKWAIKYNVIEYALENVKNIENEMNKHIINKKNNKNTQPIDDIKLQKRTMNKHNITVVIRFS